MRYKAIVLEALEKLNKELEFGVIREERTTNRVITVSEKLIDRRKKFIETMSMIVSKYTVLPEDIDEMNAAIKLLDHAVEELGEVLVDSNDTSIATIETYHKFIDSLKAD